MAVVLKDTKTKNKRNARELKLQHMPSQHLSQLHEADESRARSRSSAMRWTSAGLARPTFNPGKHDGPASTISGVDGTPIVWVSILSFFSEILLGPQGLLTILQKN